MTAACANPACTSDRAPNGPRCAPCASYLTRVGAERPRALIRWPDAGHPLLRTPELADLLGVSYRVIDHAIRSGLADPTIRAAGSGYVHGWDLGAAVACAVGLAIRQAPPSDLPRRETVRRPGSYPWVEIVVDVAGLYRMMAAGWPCDRARYLDEVAP